MIEEVHLGSPTALWFMMSSPLKFSYWHNRMQMKPGGVGRMDCSLLLRVPHTGYVAQKAGPYGQALFAREYIRISMETTFDIKA